MLACRRRNRSRSSERPLKPSGTFDRKVYSKTLANTPSVTRTEQSGAWLRDAIKNIGVHFTAHTMEMRCYDKWEYSSTILLWTILAGNTVQLSYYGPFWPGIQFNYPIMDHSGREYSLIILSNSSYLFRFWIILLRTIVAGNTIPIWTLMWKLNWDYILGQKVNPLRNAPTFSRTNLRRTRLGWVSCGLFPI